MLMMFLQAGPIFAQANRQQQAGEPDAGAMAGMLVCQLVVAVVILAVQIFFLLSLSKCLAECSPRNRTMEPGQVWLNLIPFFNLVWLFITVIRISESLKNEFQARRMRSDDPEFAKMTGILYIVLSIACGPIGWIFWIMYWLKISAFKNELINNKKGGGSEDDYDDQPRRGRGQRDAVDDDDEEDDRPRRPRRPRDDDDD